MMIENLALQYCSICDCILTFKISRFDINDILKIKKRIISSEYITNSFLISDDIKRVNNLILIYKKNTNLKSLLDELLEYFDSLKIFISIS